MCLLWLLMLPAFADADDFELADAVALHDGVLEVDAGEQWATTVTAPVFTTDQAPILSLRAYVTGGGGCNYILQILIDGVPLTDRFHRPRLLNKPMQFDPPGTDYHFTWFRRREAAWMTIFARDFDTNWGGSGQDTRFVLDLSGLVRSGETVTIGLRHRVANLPELLRVERAPLVADDLRLGLLPVATVERLRAELSAGRTASLIQAESAVPTGEEPGAPPYELVWSGRAQDPAAQVTFEDLDGWTLRRWGDAEVSLTGAVAKRLWRPRTARFRYAGGTRETTVELRPPQPIPIGDRFDAADLWLYGALKRYVDQPLQIQAVVEDSIGRELVVDLGGVTATYWMVQHGVVPAAEAARLVPPLRFTALVLDGCKVEGERDIWLDSLAFYVQRRQPERRFVRPDPPVFPIGDRGLLPPDPAGVEVAAEAIPGGGRLISRGADGVLTWVVRPANGCLHGVTARFDNGPELRPLSGGGLRGLTGEPETLIESVLDGDRLRARWRRGETTWRAEYRASGRSLIIDLTAEAGAPSGLLYGTVAGLPDGRAIEVPYLLFSSPPTPCVAFGGGLFVSVMPDLYHSDFSVVDGQPGRGDGVGLLGGTTYEPLTDGRLNPLRERVLVTIAPKLAEVLPGIPNPPSPNRERLASYLFYMCSRIRPGQVDALHRFGLDRLIVNDFAGFYVDDYAEGFAGRWRPHPDVPLERIQAYREQIRDRGNLFGCYLDTREFFPLNEAWHPDKLCLSSDGDWREGWFGNFQTKPTVMRELTRGVGEKVAQLYPPECVYLDVHTNLGPTAMDFEAGIEGAGIARVHVLGNGDAIAEARRWWGSTISEGIYRWLYAGVCDMDYAQIRSHTRVTAELPPLVDFDLLRLHPLQHGTMMGYAPDTYLGEEDRRALYQDSGGPMAPEPYHRYLAASLAYGHMAMLGYSYVPPPARFVQTWAMMMAPQQAYLTDTVEEIRYHDGQRFVTTEQALAGGANATGRVRVRYRRGTVVHANLSQTEPWTVPELGRDWVLPPNGWLVTGPEELFAAGIMVDGARRDVVRSREYLYLNSGLTPAVEGPVAVTGAVFLRRAGAGWRVVPCGDLGRWRVVLTEGLPARHQDFLPGPTPPDRGCRDLRLDTLALLGKPPDRVEVTAADLSGHPVAADAQPVDGRWLAITTSAEGVDYQVQ